METYKNRVMCKAKDCVKNITCPKYLHEADKIEAKANGLLIGYYMTPPTCYEPPYQPHETQTRIKKWS